MPSLKKLPGHNKPKDSTVELENLEAIWAEIESIVPRYSPPAPGDISREMLARRFNITNQSADERIRKLVETGEWEMVWVKERGKRPRTVLRKIDENKKVDERRPATRSTAHKPTQ